MAEIKGWNEARLEIAKTMLVFGDPDSVGEQLTAVKATGVDGFTINLAVNGHQTERIAPARRDRRQGARLRLRRPA